MYLDDMDKQCVDVIKYEDGKADSAHSSGSLTPDDEALLGLVSYIEQA